MKRIISLALTLALLITAAIFIPTASAEESMSLRTSLAGASAAQRNNIELAASSISGAVLSYGEGFSFNDTVGPRSERYGYEAARNGRGVKVTGGGVAQVASTLYLALLDMGADVDFTDLYFYGESFTGDYVSSGSEAVMVDYSSGYDFAFESYEDDLCIEMWTTENYLYCRLSIDRKDIFLDWSPSTQARRSAAQASIWIDGSDSLYNNILLAASSINDTALSPGGLFSFNDSVGPRSARYGYEPALNGRGVEVVGGGVAQVASVIWLAVKNMDDIAIVEKTTYGSRYNQSYVSSSSDAILTDYGNGTDFSFRNAGDDNLRISVYLDGSMLRCEIYRE